MGVPAPLPNQGPTGLQYSGGIKGIVIATLPVVGIEPIGVALPACEPLHGGNIKDVIIGEMAGKERGLPTCGVPNDGYTPRST
jgi:hypothetical protein